MDLGPLCRVLARHVIPRCAVPVVLLLAGGATPQDLALVKGLVGSHGLEPHVRLFANFPLKEKANLFAMSDVLVSPIDNTQETFGLSLLEAMAAGLPVVASRFDGYKDLVEDGVDGYLIDTRWSDHDPVGEWFDLMDRDIAQLFQAQGVALDLDQLGSRILALVGDPDLRRKFGLAGRSKVAATYRWSQVVARYQREWDRLKFNAGSSRPEAAGENPYCLGPSLIFPGYASHRLTMKTRVRATDSALDETPYNETAPILSATLLQAVLNSVASETTLGLLVRSMDAPASQVMFAVQWLLKYGFIVEVAAG